MKKGNQQTRNPPIIKPKTILNYYYKNSLKNYCKQILCIKVIRFGLTIYICAVPFCTTLRFEIQCSWEIFTNGLGYFLEKYSLPSPPSIRSNQNN